MISGVHKDLMPLAQAGRPEKPERAGKSAKDAGLSGAPSFAEKLGSVDRTVRNEKPGREDRVAGRNSDSDREGERANERDPSPQLKKGPSRVDHNLESKSVRTKARREEPLSARPDVESRSNLSLNANPQPYTQAAPVSVPQESPEVSDDSFDGVESGEPSRDVYGRDGVNVGNGASKAKVESERAAQMAPVGVTSTAIAATAAQEPKPLNPVAEETLAALDSMRDEQTQVRRSALTDFMSRMQNEFGVKPEKIVEAFSKMDEQTLMAPPEESTKEFLSNLSLKPDQQPRAAALYKDMVRTTGEAALNEKIFGLEENVVFDVASPRDESLRALNQSIDDLNSSFALRYTQAGNKIGMPQGAGPMNEQMRAQLAAEQMNAQLSAQLNAKGSQLAPTDSKSKKSSDGDVLAATALAAGNSEALAGLATDASASSTAASSGSTAGSMPSMMSALGFGSESGMGSSASEEFGSGSSMANGGASGGSTIAAGANEATGKSAFASSMAAAESKNSSKKSVEGKPAAGGGETQVNADAQAAGGIQQQPVATKSAAGPAGMLAQRPVVTPQDEQTNIKEMIHQAQLAVKKGGGEIKMDLKPEGMGQVRLKVSVQDGQVSVQMLTQNDEAKRMLEKGLHELKSNLAAHQLKVDNLKVDVGQELQKHMDKQQGDEQARQSARQFASDVMGQFRDERQAFQQGFMENSGWKQYARQDRRKPMTTDSTTPSGSVEAANVKSRSRSASDGRLDLVA